jgi:repressor LexA
MKDSGKDKQPKLTPRQAETLEWVRHFIRLHGKPPTMREIGTQFGIASSSVFDLVKTLERKGFLKRGEGASRTVELVGKTGRNKPDTGMEIPVVGRVAAGRPIWAVENVEGAITVDAALARRYERLFALHVAGDSMIDAGILDGDLVVVAQQEWADSGDIVVALIGDEATVKRLSLGRKGAIRLVAANPKYDDIVISDPDFRIQGKVIGVQRHIG